MRFNIFIAILVVVTTLKVVQIQQKGFISNLNKFYVYFRFDNKIDNLLIEYKLTLSIEDFICNNDIVLNSFQQTVRIECQYSKSYQMPVLILSFQNRTNNIQIEKQKYYHNMNVRNLYFISQPQIIQKYWYWMEIISKYMGYFLIGMFLLNILPYLLPLLRILQLTSTPKILDITMFGIFYFNKFTLYQLSFYSPYFKSLEENSLQYQLEIHPTFTGFQYSSLMQQCILMLVIFSIYCVSCIVLFFCKNICAVKYFIKRFVKDIFVNTASLYLIMHIPLGLTSLVGIKFGKHHQKYTDILQFFINIVGVCIFIISPFIFSILLGFFKKNKYLFLRKCYLFSSRYKSNSQVYILIDYLKDTVFVSSIVLFKKQFTLFLMIIIVLSQIKVISKRRLFNYSLLMGLKLLQLIFLLLFILFHFVFYLFQKFSIKLSLNIVEILGYFGISILGIIYFIVVFQILVGFIYQCRNSKIKKQGKYRILNIYQIPIQRIENIVSQKPLKESNRKKQKQTNRIRKVQSIQIYQENVEQNIQNYEQAKVNNNFTNLFENKQSKNNIKKNLKKRNQNHKIKNQFQKQKHNQQFEDNFISNKRDRKIHINKDKYKIDIEALDFENDIQNLHQLSSKIYHKQDQQKENKQKKSKKLQRKSFTKSKKK